MLPSARYKNLGSARASSTHVIFPPFDRPKLFYSWIGFCLNFWHCRVLGIHMCRYCVCYIHEEFCGLLNVLMNSTVVDENCSWECEFCSQGLDLQVRLRKSIYTGLCDIFFVSLVIYIQIPSEIFSLQGLFIAFVSLKILVILISLNLSSAALKETAPQLSPASCNAQAQSLVAQKVIYSVPRSTAHLRSGWLRT